MIDGLPTYFHLPTDSNSCLQCLIERAVACKWDNNNNHLIVTRCIKGFANFSNSTESLCIKCDGEDLAG